MMIGALGTAAAAGWIPKKVLHNRANRVKIAVLAVMLPFRR